MERNFLQISDYEGTSFKRWRSEAQITSKIDYIITTRDTEGESEVIETQMSDHDMVISEIHGKNGTLRPRRKAQKEMFYSNLINEIKEKHVKYYLRYLL